MKILVSGHSGFLGSHLVKRLQTLEGITEVVGWDIKTGQNVCDPNLYEDSLDAIFHLACPVDPGHYGKVALATALASSQGTQNMLKLALQNKAKFLYVSSSDIYGHTEKFPYKEDDWGLVDPTGERSYYSESKRFGEMLTMIYHRWYELDARIVRPFNIYGPVMRYEDSRVIPSFFRNFKENKPLEITGDGSTTRTFCYVDDFTDAIIRAMFYPRTNGEIFNIGTEEEITMMDLAKMIDGNFKTVGDVRPGEQLHRKPDITKARTLLQWEPKTSLKRGLELMWKSYQ